MKQEEPLQCGGAYIKLLANGAVSAPDMWDNETPYIIMFGPDKCGGTNKVSHPPNHPPTHSLRGWMEEEEADRTRYCTSGLGGWVGE